MILRLFSSNASFSLRGAVSLYLSHNMSRSYFANTLYMITPSRIQIYLFISTSMLDIESNSQNLTLDGLQRETTPNS